MPDRIPTKTIGRLSLYRRYLAEMLTDGVGNVYSHQLAQIAGVTSAQLRRDVMAVGYTGSPTRGYDVQGLMESIGQILDASTPQNVALVGVGNLGRAILAYFAGRRPNLRIVAAFDSNPEKCGRVIHGCRCYTMNELGKIAASEKINTAVVAVPSAQAQKVADALVANGFRGLLNFAPTHLRVPKTVYVENVDITTSLEKVAFFARPDNRRKD